MNQEERYLDHQETPLIRGVLACVIFIVLGAWMMINPEPPFTTNRVIVQGFLELWSFGFGVFLFLGCGLYLVREILKLRMIKGTVWKKYNDGVVFFEKKKQLTDIITKYIGDDLLVFSSHHKQVFCLQKFKTKKNKLEKYYKASISDSYSFDSFYWYADEEGFAVINKGEFLTDMSSKRIDDDLEVQLADEKGTLYLKGYFNLIDNTLREVKK